MARPKYPKTDWRAGLNDRQIRFCQEYLVDLDIAAAGARAGYGGKSKDRKAAAAVARQARINPKVANAIALLLEQQPGVTRTMIVEQLAAIAQSDIVNYINVETMEDLEALPDEARRAVKSIKRRIDKDGNVTVELELWDKVAALHALSRATGMHVSRAQVNTAVNVTIEDKSDARAQLFARIDAIAGRLPAPNSLPLIELNPIKDKDTIENE
jgi:phage terminase small subunit